MKAQTKNLLHWSSETSLGGGEKKKEFLLKKKKKSIEVFLYFKKTLKVKVNNKKNQNYTYTHENT